MAIPKPRPGAVALITGASSGIGSELARQLCARGHDVVLVARRRDRLEVLAKELNAQHGRTATVLPCDLSDSVDRARMASDLEALALDVDVLVMCAGTGFGGWFLELTPDQINQMVRVNIESALELARRYAPAMAARRNGALLFVSSIGAGQPVPYYSVYSATKAAVSSFAEALRAELASDGITVTTLTPGLVQTDFLENADFTDVASRVPQPMVITPQECARAGLDGLARGRRKVMPRAGVRISSYLSSHMQRDLWLHITVRLMRKLKTRSSRVHP